MAGTLTRSRIEEFDRTANQLSQYASRWRAAAGDLDRAAEGYVSQIANPGGTQWQGQAWAATLDAAQTDRVAVTGAVMHAHAMADVAERGSSTLLGAREGALEAIAQAEADDFSVGEDLSVADNHAHIDPATYAARMSQAQAHLGYIEHRAGLLEAENGRIATQLGAGASQMGGMVPATWKAKGGTGDGRGQIRLVDNQTQSDNPVVPSAVQPDPRNPFVGDERFGHWQNVTPPPYTGAAPPAPWTGHKSMEGFPGKGPAGPSGFYVPGGKTWADDSAAPMMYGTEQYRFRISGEDYTSYTRMVGGQQQQWVQYTYDAQRYTQVNLGANAWAPKGPNEITGELGGVMTGGLGGITPPPKIEGWKPMSLPQIASLSGANPAATYYIPNGCGGQFTFSGGVPVGGIAPPPTAPSMIAGP